MDNFSKIDKREGTIIRYSRVNYKDGCFVFEFCLQPKNQVTLFFTDNTIMLNNFQMQKICKYCIMVEPFLSNFT